MSLSPAPRTSTGVTATPTELFDPALRRLRFARAGAIGGSFLLDRMFDEVVDRLAAISRPIDRLLVVGPDQPGWRARLAPVASNLDWLDPAERDEDTADLPVAAYDAALAVGSLDTVNRLPFALRAIAGALRPDAPLLGAMLGGNSLPVLRRALIEADRATGAASPRSHPRIDPPTLAALLGGAGFAEPVVDVDRLTLRYATCERLVADLRAAAATNMLTARAKRWPGRDWAARVTTLFATGADADGRVAESIDILHFHGWARPRN